MSTLVASVAPSASACAVDMTISVPPTSASGATRPTVKWAIDPSAAIRSSTSPACAPVRLADVSPTTTVPLLMNDDTSRPIATPIESSGSAVTDIGKYHEPNGPGAACTGTPARVT
jgi:hypothetical protein